MKVFSMNDYDWMAGETLESCKADYLKNYGGDEHDEDFADTYELTPEDMQHYKIADEDGTVRTFQEQLDKMIAEGDDFPQFFASTEC